MCLIFWKVLDLKIYKFFLLRIFILNHTNILKRQKRPNLKNLPTKHQIKTVSVRYYRTITNQFINIGFSEIRKALFKH